MEASLQAAQGDLAYTESELEKQRALTEKLENDLLQMDQHQPQAEPSVKSSIDSMSTFASMGNTSGDGLAGLDFGKKSTVRIPRVSLCSVLECS